MTMCDIATKFGCIIVTVAVLAIPVKAAPLEDFRSDEYLKEAVRLIGDLSPRQLELFGDYLASCTGVSRSEIQTFFCEKSRNKFELAYLKQNELSGLIDTVALVDELIQSLADAEPGSEDRDMLAELVSRSGTVNSELNGHAAMHLQLSAK